MNDPTADYNPETPTNDALDSSSAGEATTPTAHGRELAALKQERDAAQDQLKRSLADLANIRRRQSGEMQQARTVAVESLARELLPVLDNFNLALESHDQQAATGNKSDAEALVQGLRMVRALFEAALEQHGVREIEGHGHPFDPNKHEAVGIDASGDAAPGHVAKVLQRGYFLADRVLRPSRVLVGEQRSTSDATPAADE